MYIYICLLVYMYKPEKFSLCFFFQTKLNVAVVRSMVERIYFIALTKAYTNIWYWKKISVVFFSHKSPFIRIQISLVVVVENFQK